LFRKFAWSVVVSETSSIGEKKLLFKLPANVGPSRSSIGGFYLLQPYAHGPGASRYAVVTVLFLLGRPVFLRTSKRACNPGLKKLARASVPKPPETAIPILAGLFPLEYQQSAILWVRFARADAPGCKSASCARSKRGCRSGRSIAWHVRGMWQQLEAEHCDRACGFRRRGVTGADATSPDPGLRPASRISCRAASANLRTSVS